MSAITAKASRKMKKYAVLTREPRCFLGSFDFSWEQRKFGEITSKYEDPVPTPHDGYYRLGIRSHAKGTFHSYVAKGQELETAQMHRVAAGNFIVNITFGWEHAVAITDKNDAGKLVSHRFPQFSFAEGMVPEFFRYVIVDEKFRHHLWLASPGGAGRNRVLKLDEMLNYLMRFPSRDEQIKIAEFFRHLDNLITLHQRKCALLFSSFQALISMMFTTSTFSWEQRKAIDIADYSKGNGYSKGDLTDAGTPIILYGRLYTKYQFAISEVDTFAVPRNGAVYSQGNEVIVPASGETAEDIARASAVEESGVLLGGDLNILRPFDFINPLFLALAISNGEPQKKLAKKAQGKSVVHIHNTDIQEVTIAYPSRTEQDRIVSVFRQLDNLITLHQRKCISFTGRAGRLISTVNKKRITSSWEQRKFEEIAVRSSVICSDDTLPRVEYEDIVSGTGRLNKDIYAKQSSKSGIVFHQGDVLYGKLRPYLQNWLLPTFDGLAVGDFWVLQPQNADSSFLYRLIQSRQFDEVANQSTGTKMPRADWKLMSKTVFSIPSNISEQAAIGTYFTALDNLITLHQRKPFLMKWRTSDANRNQTNRLVL